MNLEFFSVALDDCIGEGLIVEISINNRYKHKGNMVGTGPCALFQQGRNAVCFGLRHGELIYAFSSAE